MYTIGKLAKRAAVNTDCIRFYERQGLIAPARRTDSGYRLYTDEALRRVAVIRHAQRCGFSLAEIGELLQVRSGASGAGIDGYRLAVEKKAQIEKTIEALKAMSEALSLLLTNRECAAADSARGESALVHALAPAPGSPLAARAETARRTGTPLAPHVQPPCLIRAPDVFQRKD